MRYLATIPVLAALVLGAGACKSESQPKPPDLGQVMPILPLPPEFEPVSTTGSEEALQLTFRSTLDQDMVARFYRQTFTTEPWNLVSDTKAPDGSSVLYAEVEGAPLWVRITTRAGAPGSTIQLSGALVNQDEAPIDSPATEGDGN